MPATNSYFTSPATGRHYWITDSGVAILVSMLHAEEEQYVGCECEQDWNCGLHGGTSRPTWIETRYSGMDD
jgi:hypothetical protein